MEVVYEGSWYLQPRSSEDCIGGAEDHLWVTDASLPEIVISTAGSGTAP